MNFGICFDVGREKRDDSNFLCMSLGGATYSLNKVGYP